MQRFCDQQQCGFTELAWYFHGRSISFTDRPTSVSILLSCTSGSIRHTTNLRQIGLQDGDTLDVCPVLDYLSTDEDERWMAQLEVTEAKINHLQTEVDFKRAELEAAARENETIAARVSAIRSSICLLRHSMIPRKATRGTQP
jgi:hypothetical protein